jgi:hypothetical protein
VTVVEVLDDSAPHPVLGARLKVTPAFLESWETFAVIVTAEVPAFSVVELALLARLSVMREPPPHPVCRNRPAPTMRVAASVYRNFFITKLPPQSCSD